ncbi:MAG: hypothetical protein ACJ8DC_16805 [Gemmatimonadales bacterium]
MKRMFLGVVLGLFASSAAAQQNPFKLPKNNTSVTVQYAYAGDMQGTGERAVSKDRVMAHQSTTGKFFGKTSTTDTWTLITPDSSYSADLTKKTGVAMPNVLPYMAKAYDDLDGTSKQRLHQNMQEMVQMISRAFGTQTMVSDEKTATQTYAGEKCDERTFGTFSICSMQDAPAVPLHVSGSMMCVSYEETATAVKKGEPSAAELAPPAGITFQRDTTLASPDSMARGFVKYLASQELADSIAKAKSEMASRSSTSNVSNASTTSAAHEPTPEEREQQRQACEALKNFNLGKAMSDATKQVFSEAVNEAVQEKKMEAKEGAKQKIKGLLKKPHF